MTDAPIVLKYKDWPQADKSAWKALFEAADIFEESGPCAHWAEGSRHKRRQGYGQWLSFLLRREGQAIVLAPAKRVTQVRVRAYIVECEARLAPKSTAGLVLDLYVLARAMSPELSWRWLETVCKRLQKKADKKSLPPPLSITAQEIFQWSLKRMQEVSEDEDYSDKRRASQFRQALMIGFLISRPVRRRAVLAMDVERHISPLSDGFNIQFSSADMKDKKDRNFPLPRALVAPFEEYLDVHRQVLLAAKTSNGLWISQYGNPITPDGFSRELPKITKRYLNVSMRPHAFRHVAATSIAEFDPVHVNIIRDVLGHATLDMAEKHYNRASGITSCNDYQDIIGDICKSRPRPKLVGEK